MTTFEVSELIGFMAGACSTLAFMPQVIKVWRTKSTGDISLWMYVVLCTGVALWCLYGALIGSPSVVITNLFILSLSLIILFMKLQFEKNKT